MSYRKNIYQKYYNSNIFNQNQNLSSLSYKNIKVRCSQKPLIKTKDDIFNTESKNLKEEKLSKSGIRHRRAYSKIFGSDIFFQNKIEKIKRKEGIKMIKDSNKSDFFQQMKNNDDFKEEIINYTLKHRKEKKAYNPDKYLKMESASGEYYKQIYDSEGSSVLRERPFSVDTEKMKQYEINKRYLKKKIQILNDFGFDKKRKPEENKAPLSEMKNGSKKDIVNKNKKNILKKSITYRKITPRSICKINKRINLTSNIFANQNEKETGKKKENIKSKINNNINRDEYYHLNDNSKRNLTNNDPKIWGALHSRWSRTKIDWSSPETEIMFGNTVAKEMKEIYGKKGPNAFQRMINQMADSQNADTITGVKKDPIVNIQKPLTERKINGELFGKFEKAINGIQNLKDAQKNKIKNNVSTTLLNGENNWNEKVKNLNEYYTNNNKILVNKKEIKEKNGNEFSEYVLTYPIKGNFEQYNEKDIKLLFGNKGLHIYDIQKNLFDKGTFNNVVFKMKINEGEEKIKSKIYEIKKDLEKKNCKILIDRRDKKDVKKKMKNYVIIPGHKNGIINDNFVNQNNKFKIMPDKLRNMHSFSKEFKNVDYKYKKYKKVFK